MDRMNRMLGRDNSYRVAPAPDRPARNAGGGAPTFDVRLPPNARPGVTIMARAPNGRNVRLTVPTASPRGGPSRCATDPLRPAPLSFILLSRKPSCLDIIISGADTIHTTYTIYTWGRRGAK